MDRIDAAGFEAKFRNNIDPWNYAASPFERHKRNILRHVCGDRHFGRGLELACANGETTKALAPLCGRLLATDASPSAVAEARRRTCHLTNVEVHTALLPDAFPRARFDLIVASEIFYYLEPRKLDLLLSKIHHALAPGGRLVCLHHIIRFDDAACHPAIAQLRASRFLGKRCQLAASRSYGRFAVQAFLRSP